MRKPVVGGPTVWPMLTAPLTRIDTPVPAAVLAAAQLLQRGDTSAAAAVLHTVSPVALEDPLTALTHAALVRRAAGISWTAAGTNLYTRPLELSQLALFGRLASQVPLVQLARTVANTALVRTLDGRDDVTLLDLGAGDGRQMADVARLLASRPGRPVRRLRVVCIDPAADALEGAHERIAAAVAGRRVALDVQTHALRLEEIDRVELAALVGSSPALAVNAAFALHHLPRGEWVETRQLALERVRHLHPGAVVLTEPDTDHLISDLGVRVVNCARHFGGVFAVIDALGLTDEEARVLKSAFFGREIDDILGTPERERSERHESTSAWAMRLRAAGFRPVHGERLLPEVTEFGPCTLRAAEDHVSVTADGLPLVSVLVGRPDPGMAAVRLRA